MDSLQFLSAGRTNLDELLRSSQFSFVGLELRASRDEACLRFGEFRTEHGRHCLSLADVRAKVGDHLDDSS
jgi:hypothetical protein